MQQDMQEKQTQKSGKQMYEKPQLGRMSLVADRVLSYCKLDTSCENQDVGFVFVVTGS
jgi:hypothetical protein